MDNGLTKWFSVSSLIISVVLAFFLRKVANFLVDYREKVHVTEGVSQLKSHWLLGHIKILQPTQEGIYYSFSYFHKIPKCMKVWFGPFVMYLSCFHPDVIKPVLASDHPKDEMAYHFLKEWIGDGLLISTGKKWRRNRHMLTRAFHFDILKEYLVVFNNTTKELLEKWDSKKQYIFRTEAYNDISLLALDNILQCIMSTRSNCQQHGRNYPYLKAVRTITEIAMKRLFNPIYQSDLIFHLSPTGWRYKKALKVAHEYTESVIRERKSKLDRENIDLEKYIADKMEVGNNGKASLDFLDILLLSKDDKGVGLTHQEICDEVNTFVFEGHDTVSSGLSWAFYNMALHEEVQEKCRKEALKILNGRDHLVYDDLAKFEYLTMFIKESLRMHTPVFSIARTIRKPLMFPRGFGPDHLNTDPKFTPGEDSSLTLPPNFNIGVSLLQLHRNPHVFKDPDKFDPERFTRDNCEKRPNHAYLPFSAGPRNCIGHHFAMNEMKTVLALSLVKFRIKVDESAPQPVMEPYIILRSKTGIHLKMERI